MRNTWRKDFRRYKLVYLMLVPVIAYYVLFHYVPMAGIVIGFKRYVPRLGILDSPWVGFQYFIEFFQDMFFFRLMRNTFMLNVYDIIVGFPMPILIALILNELRSRRFKTTVQTAVYMPHFISVLVLCGLIIDFCAREGVVNDILQLLGMERSALLARPELFKPIFIVSNLWQYAGWSSIIYTAALSGINTELFDAARVDGCKRFGLLWHVTLPGLLPTIVIMLILRVGNIMTVGYEKVILLYNALTYETADVLSSYVFRRGILEANFSYSTAVGLFNSLINFAFLFGANALSRKLTEESLW